MNIIDSKLTLDNIYALDNLCDEGKEWLENTGYGLNEAWDKCSRGDWMIWVLRGLSWGRVYKGQNASRLKWLFMNASLYDHMTFIDYVKEDRHLQLLWYLEAELIGRPMPQDLRDKHVELHRELRNRDDDFDTSVDFYVNRILTAHSLLNLIPNYHHLLEVLSRGLEHNKQIVLLDDWWKQVAHCIRIVIPDLNTWHYFTHLPNNRYEIALDENENWVVNPVKERSP